jgi:hypothetical protein
VVGIVEGLVQGTMVVKGMGRVGEAVAERLEASICRRLLGALGRRRVLREGSVGWRAWRGWQASLYENGMVVGTIYWQGNI